MRDCDKSGYSYGAQDAQITVTNAQIVQAHETQVLLDTQMHK